MKLSFSVLFVFLLLTISCSQNDEDSSTELLCGVDAVITSEEDYDSIDTSNYSIIDVQLDGDCLKLTVSASGCDGKSWGSYFYSVDAFYAVFPMKREAKLELINNENCLAVIESIQEFNLAPFQI
ncbi:hypothetical protein [Psychroflexus sp. ALD_RP9]|uniref:hypothetical protein n=1 Tax=Psychroflexus sp. ALD_RP9 TaxID=2777186 RepID=UPI001A900579|nr:hypothetical protein [Psychroflexus sp. ALD_RP9]QSS96945.1 hypothetical protein IMZ30_10925 [Psychroflexus sp. ALD_RP9]